MTKRPSPYLPPKRSPGSIVQQAPKRLRKSRRGDKAAKLFQLPKRQHNVPEAAMSELRECYLRHWSEVESIVRAGPRKIVTVGSKKADLVRAEWLVERAELLARHNLPANLPIHEGMGR